MQTMVFLPEGFSQILKVQTNETFIAEIHNKIIYNLLDSIKS